MSTSANWEDRFNEFVRVSPHDRRGIWAMIVECLDDDDSLSHTFNSVLKAHRVPHIWCQDLRQDLALRLVQTICVHPQLNLDHRRTGIPAAAWLYSVIDKLCADVVRAKRTKERPHASLDTVSTDGDDLEETGDRIATQGQRLAVALETHRNRERAVDAALDLRAVFAGYDQWTRALLLVYLVDLRVRTVAVELDVPYVTAWRTVRQAEAKLREQLCAYR